MSEMTQRVDLERKPCYILLNVTSHQKENVAHKTKT